ncbi:hypothetical protein AXG93_3818s1110 [Marchantia polymorpha subsp. ruderalis]|uniref:Potassium channel tetramerisation-type BTB domain-containing protein n=1 Tax=Marchantia polymorpha subsp. ruderalis TaxID=1480154 RepID=A0A176VI80_MARPO|nr:hypothetical protein AXG93_3818s1110 [Marchantia polymorpha subsp. ruderalis]
MTSSKRSTRRSIRLHEQEGAPQRRVALGLWFAAEGAAGAGASVSASARFADPLSDPVDYFLVCVSMQRETESMLAVMFSGRHKLHMDKIKNAVFIDRDGTHFRHILNWLRDGVIPLLDPAAYTELQREAQFYQLNIFKEQLTVILSRKEEEEGKAEMTRSQDLSGVDFSNANIGNTFFIRAKLIGANFCEAEADGANFHNANLSECSFIKAGMRGAVLAGALLQSANLQDAILSNSSFCNADLRSAHLQNADLSNANLSNAILEGANLKGARLYGANLKGANLQRAYLRDVDLRNTVRKSPVILNN